MAKQDEGYKKMHIGDPSGQLSLLTRYLSLCINHPSETYVLLTKQAQVEMSHLQNNTM